MSIVTEKMALKAGSSRQGSARLASVRVELVSMRESLTGGFELSHNQMLLAAVCSGVTALVDAAKVACS